MGKPVKTAHGKASVKNLEKDSSRPSTEHCALWKSRCLGWEWRFPGHTWQREPWSSLVWAVDWSPRLGVDWWAGMCSFSSLGGRRLPGSFLSLASLLPIRNPVVNKHNWNADVRKKKFFLKNLVKNQNVIWKKVNTVPKCIKWKVIFPYFVPQSHLPEVTTSINLNEIYVSPSLFSCLPT